ncbi:MAG: DUF6033 family protein [Lachnospiraceae bacterium]|nr:DUF6033 family protein [Lachnospiraceae bacterium]
MSKIEGYSIYQSFYEKSVKSNKTEQTEKQKVSESKAAKTDRLEKENKVTLSKDAKKLLEELKKTYGNMDFIIADYDSEEEAQEYLSRGTKEYSVLIDPETLEAMAADEETKKKYIGILEDSVGQLTDIKEQLGEKESEVTHIGISIDGDGKVSFFAELEKVGERQKEFVDKMREAKKAEKEENYEKTKKTTVQADSVEELLEKIKAVDWEQIKAEDTPTSGSRFDFSV